MPRWGLFLLAGLILWMLLPGCGKRVHKQTLNADEYFEYAKKEFDKGDYLDAITEFNVIVLRFSGNPVVDDAQYYLAESHFKQGEYLIAISEYQKLLNDYPTSPYAVLAQFKIGMSYYKLSPRPELDQENAKRAVRMFQIFIEEHPDHELTSSAQKFIDELREKLARKKMIAATTYRKMGEFESARIYYDIILEEYYDTPQAVFALYWKGECLYKLKNYAAAQNAFAAFVEKYPGHRYTSRARKKIEKLAELLNSSKAPEHTQLDEQQAKD